MRDVQKEKLSDASTAWILAVISVAVLGSAAGWWSGVAIVFWLFAFLIAGLAVRVLFWLFR